jgi:hypothetical protein
MDSIPYIEIEDKGITALPPDIFEFAGISC